MEATKTASVFARLLLVVTAAVTVASAGMLLWPSAAPLSVLPTKVIKTEGFDTLAIFFVSNSCAACREPSLVARTTAAKSRLSSMPGGMKFIGVAIDVTWMAGLEVLHAFGEFQEISAGGGWANSLALQSIWSDTAAIGGVPQMVVIERALTTTEHRVHVASERILARLYGLEAMADWLEKQ